MNKDLALFRGLIVIGVGLLLAVILGYLLATPEQRSSLAAIGLLVGLFLFPLLLRWHHYLVIISCNIGIAAFFLPGKPRLVLVAAGISLSISIISWILAKQKTFIHYPAITYSLLALAMITLVTMLATGGLGGRVFGSDNWGVGRYVGVLGAIMAYFALAARPVPPHLVKRMASLFFLGGVTAVIFDVGILAGPHLYFLTSFFQQGMGYYEHAYSSGFTDFQRFPGVATGMTAFCYFMMMRYGIKGLADWRRLWRGLIFVMAFGLALLGGFRSTIGEFAILFVIQFYFEGLFRSRFLFLPLAAILLATAVMVSFSDQLPLPVQRAISFLPVKVNPMVRADARSSLDWRLEMWQTALPDVQKYWYFGKGFSFNSSDLYLGQYGMEHGLAPADTWALITGDYHSGPLTLIIPLGIYGMIVFLIFCWGSIRALYANYRNSDVSLRHINTFMLSLFITKFIWYLIFYGEFHLDLVGFTCIVGISLALNGGVKKPASTMNQVLPQTQNDQTSKKLQLQPV